MKITAGGDLKRSNRNSEIHFTKKQSFGSNPSNNELMFVSAVRDVLNQNVDSQATKRNVKPKA